MKKLFLAFCSAFIGLTLASFDAEAARMGGGRSFGMQRSPSTMQRQATPAPTAPAATPAKPGATGPAPAPQSGMSRWMGPLAGLAAGLGLAALFSHFGLGEGMGSLLMILLLVGGAVLLFRLLARRSQPEAGMRYATAGADANPPARFEPVSQAGGGAAEPPQATNIPADFDTDGFLRHAKLNFVRLQAANDAGNLDDIREFTTPEVFAEIKLQLGERGSAAQQTDVMQLHAQLLDVASEEKRHVASVRFYGLIREGAETPQSFDEVWHLTKPVDGASGWVVAGIQQVQ